MNKGEVDKARENFEKEFKPPHHLIWNRGKNRYCSRRNTSTAKIIEHHYNRGLYTYRIAYKSREAEIKRLKEQVQKAYNLITTDENKKSCKPWNQGMDILREIIKEI